MKTEQEDFKNLNIYNINENVLDREVINKFDYLSFNEVKKQMNHIIAEASDSFVFEIEMVLGIYNSLQKDFSSFMSDLKYLEFIEIEAGTRTERVMTAYNSDHNEFTRKYYLTLNKALDKDKLFLNITLVTNEWFSHAESLGIDVNQEKNNVLMLKDKLTQLDRLKHSRVFLDEAKEKLMTLRNIVDYPNSKEFSRKFEDLKSFLSEDNIAKHLFGLSPTDLKFKDGISYIVEEFKIDEITHYVDNVISSVQDKIKLNNPLYLNTKAEHYSLNLSNNSVTNFLNTKNFEDDIIVKLDMSKSQHYSQIIMFNDNSILGINKNDETVLFDSNNIQQALKTISSDYIGFVLRKKPQTASLFKEALINSDYDINGALITIRSFLEHEDILKNVNFHIAEVMHYSFESIDDLINRNVNDFKIRQYAHSITSNKYKHLYNDDTYYLFSDIKDTGVLKADIQSMIGKKIAAYHTPEEFNSGLKMFLNSINGFNPEATDLKCKRSNINNILNFNDVKVVHIENYEQSALLGSSSWCIVRDEHYFNQYTRNNSRQFFIYDFNKLSNDMDSMIGMTLLSDGEFYVAHYKDDESYKKDNYLKDIQFKLIHKFNHLFDDISPELKTKVDEYISKLNEVNITIDEKKSIKINRTI